MHTDLTPEPLPRGWSFKRYSDDDTNVDGAFTDWLVKHWGSSALTAGTINDGWISEACQDVAEQFATAIMGLQHVVDCDILVEVLCERDVTLRSPGGSAIEYSDVTPILWAATRAALNRRQGGRPFHPTYEAGKAVAA